jgi:acetolactate synthase-1/2/3 large subunit
MTVLTGAEALTALLGRRGYTRVFAYPGTSELELCAAMAARDGMLVVNARGDREAVFMAAGGNLVGPVSCAAVLHGARGLTNALGAVADVRRTEVPALCLVGMPSRPSAGFLPPHGEPGLIEAAGAFASAAIDCSTLNGLDAPGFIELMQRSLTAVGQAPYGPVLLGLPHDLLSARFVPWQLVASVEPPDGPRGELDVAAALALLRVAHRPVILVDDYLLRRPAAERLLGKLARRLGAPVLQVAYRRGPMLFQRVQKETVPTFAGSYDPADQRQRDVVESADLLITVEDRNMYPRVVGKLPACRKIAITSNPSATGKNGYLGPADAIVVGDVEAALGALARGMDEPPRSSPLPHGRPSSRTATLEARARVHPADELARAIARGLHAVEAPLLVDDSQMLGGLLARNYAFLPASIRVFGSHGGFVGGGLATAVGLAAGNPGSRVAVFLGDQDFTNGVQALAAVRELQVSLLIVVCNNGASVSLSLQEAADGFGDGVTSFVGNVPGMSYAAIARGFGLPAGRACHAPGVDHGVGVAIEAADGELAGVQGIDQHAQIRVRVVADNLGVRFLGGVDEGGKVLGEQLPVATVHPQVVDRQEVVGVPEVVALLAVARQRGRYQLGADLAHHLPDRGSELICQRDEDVGGCHRISPS